MCASIHTHVGVTGQCCVERLRERPLQGLIFKRMLTLKKDLTSDPEWRLYCWDTLQDAEATLRTPASTEKDTRH